MNTLHKWVCNSRDSYQSPCQIPKYSQNIVFKPSAIYSIWRNCLAIDPSDGKQQLTTGSGSSMGSKMNLWSHYRSWGLQKHVKGFHDVAWYDPGSPTVCHDVALPLIIYNILFSVASDLVVVPTCSAGCLHACTHFRKQTHGFWVCCKARCANVIGNSNNLINISSTVIHVLKAPTQKTQNYH